MCEIDDTDDDRKALQLEKYAYLRFSVDTVGGLMRMPESDFVSRF